MLMTSVHVSAEVFFCCIIGNLSLKVTALGGQRVLALFVLKWERYPRMNIIQKGKEI